MFLNAPESVLEKAKPIKLLISDIDGVMTDGRLFFLGDGTEFKSFHARDGYGLKLLQRSGVETAVISGRKSTAVSLRMESLGIRHVYQGFENKLEPFEELLKKLSLTSEQVAFVGDDILDLPILSRVGLPIAVANAHIGIHAFVDWTTPHIGGDGAVRDACDLIMFAQGTYDQAVKSHL